MIFPDIKENCENVLDITPGIKDNCKDVLDITPWTTSLPWGGFSWYYGPVVEWGECCGGHPRCVTTSWMDSYWRRRSKISQCSQTLQVTWFWSCFSWWCLTVLLLFMQWDGWEGEDQLGRVIASSQGEPVQYGGQPGGEIIGQATPVSVTSLGEIMPKYILWV